MYRTFSETDTASRLKELARNSSLITQSDACAMLYQLDAHLRSGLAVAARLFPGHTWNLYSAMAVGAMAGQRKSVTYGRPDPVKMLGVLTSDPSEDPARFVSAVASARISRAVTYAYLAEITVDLGKYSAYNAFEFLSKYGVPRFPVGEASSIALEFEAARSLLEEVERPFYRKAISMAISMSRGDPDQVAELFMDASDNIRRSLLRYDYWEGAIISAFLEIGLACVVPRKRAPVELPVNAWEKYRKLKSAMDSGLTRDEAAKDLGLGYDRVRALEGIFERGADYHVDDEMDMGFEDDGSEIPGELSVGFETASRLPMSEYVSRIDDPRERLLVCLSYGMYDSLEGSEGGPGPEDVEKEASRQKMASGNVAKPT